MNLVKVGVLGTGQPNPLLVKYVEAGWRGRKPGRGFYTYAVVARG
jgi:3-hydroxyacyl-CoA dehydrogenase